MSKIIGVTVGTTLPKPNFKQTDPTKGDYIKNKPDFEGLKAKVEQIEVRVDTMQESAYDDTELRGIVSENVAKIDTLNELVGNTKVETQISDAVATLESEIDNKLDVMQSDIDSKVDAVDGMGLSTNDYTTSEKDKLATVEANANFYEHPTHVSHSLGLYKVTVDESGHVSGATLAEKEDIVALGIPAQDTTYDTEISDLSNRIDGVQNSINAVDETLDGVSKEFTRYQTTNNEAVSTNASGIEANKIAIEAIQGDYLKSTDKTQLQDDISKVSDKATENASAIEILNGEGNGSVKQSIDNAFNEFAANVTNDDVVNTYKELINYAAKHGPEFTELVGEVDTIKTNIGEVETNLSNYKSEVSERFTETDTAINNHVTNTNNPHGVTKEQVGLANVDNTSDMDKPISNAVDEALQGKADSEHMHEIGEVDSLQDLLDELRADIDTNAEDIDTKADLEHAHDNLYYDKDEIEQLVTIEDIDDICGSNVIVGGGDTSISDYATKQWVQEGFQPKGDYLTAVPAGYATEEFVTNKIAEAELSSSDVDLSGYAQKSDLPTKVSQLENDKGYLTQHQSLDGLATEQFVSDKIAEAKLAGEDIDLSDYALKSDIPTDYIKSIPAEYVTEEELNAKGYLTEHQSLAGLATETYVNTEIGKINIPEALSDLTTDSTHRVVTDAEKAAWNAKSNFSGNYNDLSNKPTIPSISGLATETYVNNQIAAIPTPDVSGQINTHNAATDAHADIRTKIEEINSKIVSEVVTMTQEQYESMTQAQFASLYKQGARIIAVEVSSSNSDGSGSGSETTYINQVPISIDTDGSIFNDVGWIGRTRLSSSGATKSCEWCSTTGYIPVSAGATIRVKGTDFDEDNDYICAYKSDYSFIGATSGTNGYTGLGKVIRDGDVTILVLPSNNDIAWVRISSMHDGEDSGYPHDNATLAYEGPGSYLIVTVNQEI